MPTDFDEKATTWDDDPAKVERARAVADAICDVLEVGPPMRLLEYGAGTGLVSQFLADRVGPITLVEPSGGMRAVIARKVADDTLPAETRVWDVDLTTDPAPDERVDLVVTSMVLHHVHDLAAVATGFASWLAEGGHLAAVDLDEEDGSFHDHGFDGRHGIARHELATHLEAAGFVDVEFRPCGEVSKEGRSYPLFLATATLPA